ncbi:carbohydrate ABC transporter permease [Pseudarthrobacter sp. J75]|uniref:carbohydrate ABC transporter permease n=1 Tax=unclassified Pseudarthrobacter TaxID=2647000 RepID=UPI002E8141B6|nr:MULTISPECIES: carbohydrate ABC transporter permease [unclassified Pseudarthrobacter]MEE2523145.1 carbohydrate ABC transporter permease [Pseudarthrobacter sp. J47]MEE2529829.1 carbohydrate ABC transporter permease [Pseudarthrobacter sp. J75]
MSPIATQPVAHGTAAPAPMPPVKARKQRQSGSAWSSKIAVNAMLLLFCLYTLLPLTWLIVASTKTTSDLYGTGGFVFADFNLIENLVLLFSWENGTFVRWMVNTFAYAGLGACVSVAVSFLAGHAFDKFEFPGKERWFGFVLVGVLVPAAVTTMPLYLLASNLGLVNSFWGVFLPQVASPFGVYLARMFSASYVPKELMEAARLDGAGEFRAFLTIAAPLMKPGIVTLFLMTFSAIWNNFFLPLVMLSDTSLFPAALGIYSWHGRTVADPEFAQLVVVGSLVAIIPVIILFISLQRFWKSGIGAGALK